MHGSIGECPFKYELFGSHVPCYHSNGEFNANKVGNLIIDNHVKINYRIFFLNFNIKGRFNFSHVYFKAVGPSSLFFYKML